jgi:hypothetical protein
MPKQSKNEATMDNGTQSLSKDQQQKLLFMMLVQQHQQIAMMGMGKIKNPSTDAIERDLTASRYAIDTLQMLQDYTKGNLDSEVSEYLLHVLNTLRLNYVDEINNPSQTVFDSDEESSDEPNENI